MNDSRINRRKKKWPKRVLYLTLTLFLLLVGFGVFAGVQAMDALNQSQVDLNRDNNKSDFRNESVAINKDPISILLMGVEDYSSGGKNGRADTQIVMTIDPETNNVKMVTIPRDTRVTIENAKEYTGTHKINAAYTYGSITGYGAEKLQVETVENLLQIPIDHFVTVGFDGFRDIVGALGGVNIAIKEGFWEKNIYQNDERIYFEQGDTHLDGEESLAFVRMRKRSVNASYPRDKRQRQFLKATIDQAISAGTIFKIGEITDILGKNVKTDLTAKEILSLEKQFAAKEDLSIETIELKGQEKMVNNGYYFIPEKTDLEKVNQQLSNVLGLDSNDYFTTNTD